MTVASHFLPPAALLSGCQAPPLFSCLLSYLHPPPPSSSSIPVNIPSLRSWISILSLQVIFSDMELFVCCWQCPVFVSLEHIRHAESPEPESAFHRILRCKTDMNICKVLCYKQRHAAGLESTSSHDALQMVTSSCGLLVGIAKALQCVILCLFIQGLDFVLNGWSPSCVKVELNENSARLLIWGNPFEEYSTCIWIKSNEGIMHFWTV